MGNGLGLVVVTGLFIMVAWPIAAFLLIPNKKIGTFIGLLPVLLLGSIGGYYYLSNQYVFVQQTELSQEKIGGISLGSDFNFEEYEGSLGAGTEIDNANYKHFIDYNNLVLGVDKNNKISLISTNTNTYRTGKGIRVGDRISKILASYGEKVHKQRDEQGPIVYTYVDKEENTRLSFWTVEEKVVEIRLFIE